MIVEKLEIDTWCIILSKKLTEVSLFAAYSLDEVDRKTKAFRASANYTVGDDASSLEVSPNHALVFDWSMSTD